jgi:hypothetical protein
MITSNMRCRLSGVPGWEGAPGDTYVNRLAVTVRESTHVDTAFMGLTSSGGVTVIRKLQARASPVQRFPGHVTAGNA